MSNSNKWEPVENDKYGTEFAIPREGGLHNLKYTGDNSLFYISGRGLSIDGVPIEEGVHELKPGQVIGYDPKHDILVHQSSGDKD